MNECVVGNCETIYIQVYTKTTYLRGATNKLPQPTDFVSPLIIIHYKS